MLTRGIRIAAAAVCALALGTAVANASGEPKGPLLKALSYKPIGDVSTETNPQAKYSITVHLYAHAPSVALDITGNHGNIDESVLFPRSYGAGTHKLSIKSGALPAGKFKIAVVVNMPLDATLRGTNPATLVVSASGAGKVTKL
jgi:hypothetical protein